MIVLLMLHVIHHLLIVHVRVVGMRTQMELLR